MTYCSQCHRDRPDNQFEYAKPVPILGALRTVCDNCYFSWHCVECDKIIPFQDDEIYTCECGTVLGWDWKDGTYIRAESESEFMDKFYKVKP